MALKERMEAARLVAKWKALLAKDLPASQARLNKWDLLIAEAVRKKELQAVNQARDARRAAGRYDEAITKIAGFIKRVSLVRDDSDKITAFIANVKKYGNLANKAYKDYVYEKELFWRGFEKGDWDDRLIRWLNQDHPLWEAAFRIFKDFAQFNTTVTIG
jgi:hypothetical protein